MPKGPARRNARGHPKVPYGTSWPYEAHLDKGLTRPSPLAGARRIQSLRAFRRASQTYGRTDGHTDRHTNRQTNRQTDGQRDRETERQRDRETETETENGLGMYGMPQEI